ncbi:MAG: hypothetical protein ACR2GR_01630 [Rhodothermales bacterium]
MASSENKLYDVAISFLSQDEKYAKDLYDVLCDRLDVFYYAERQDELVSEDGEEAFGTVFRDKARVVVVFYREGWGETTMTRAERSSIKQRAYREGYGFSIWVPVGRPKSVPSFIDPQFIWYDIDRWGTKGLASRVEKGVQESGREVRPETTEDRLLRRKREIEIKKRRREYENSSEGVEAVRADLARLPEVIAAQLERYVAVVDADIPFEQEGLVVKSSSVVARSGIRFRCTFSTDIPYLDTTEGSFFGAHLERYLTAHSHDYGRVNGFGYKFTPTLDENGELTWSQPKNKYVTLEMAVEIILYDMIECIYAAQERALL